MNDKISELYEKLYFHEIDAREHLNGRLQIPLAIIMSMIALVGFMLQNLNRDIWSFGCALFYLFFVASVISISISIFYFAKSWYGNTYEFLPSAAESDSYLKLLVETYRDYEKSEHLVDQHFNEFLKNCYIKCSTNNTICNDNRSIYLHKTNTFIILAGVLAFLAFIFFYGFSLDKENQAESALLKIVKTPESKMVSFDDYPIINLHLNGANISNLEILRKDKHEQSKTPASSTAAPASSPTASPN